MYESLLNPIMALALPSSCGSKLHNPITDYVKIYFLLLVLSLASFTQALFPFVQTCTNWISRSALSRTHHLKYQLLLGSFFLCYSSQKCSQTMSHASDNSLSVSCPFSFEGVCPADTVLLITPVCLVFLIMMFGVSKLGVKGRSSNL